jgi:hypothetical protein
VAIIDPFNGTTVIRTITTETYGEIFGSRVDSSTGLLYSVQMNDIEFEHPISIVQIRDRPSTSTVSTSTNTCTDEVY